MKISGYGYLYLFYLPVCKVASKTFFRSSLEVDDAKSQIGIKCLQIDLLGTRLCSKYLGTLLQELVVAACFCLS